MPAEAYTINYTAVVIMAIVGIVAIGVMFGASYVLSPRRRSALKEIPYECGIIPEPHTWSQLHLRYYIFAILFLVFDVEAVFLFPWALVFLDDLKEFADIPHGAVFYEMIVFIGILFFGIVYGWKKGALEWR